MKALYLLILLFFFMGIGVNTNSSLALATDNVTLTDNTTMYLVLSGDDLQSISSSIGTITEGVNNTSQSMVNIFEAFIVLGVLVIAFWRKNDLIIFVISGLLLCFMSLSWIDEYTYIAIPLLALGIYQFFNAVLISVGTTPSKGASHFKALAGKIRGIFKV